jgi:hypothetical protein
MEPLKDSDGLLAQQSTSDNYTCLSRVLRQTTESNALTGGKLKTSGAFPMANLTRLIVNWYTPDGQLKVKQFLTLPLDLANKKR